MKLTIEAFLLLYKRNNSYEKANCMRIGVKFPINNPLLLCMFTYRELSFLELHSMSKPLHALLL